VRRVAAVRVEKPSGSSHIRLYHWDSDSESVRQKFTAGRSWSDLAKEATSAL
jgi:hypothetical protein